MTALDWRELPSLAALRAFEATARLGSFSAAARGLNVTPAAVAQQVRGLESELGVSLVLREGRGIALTTEGGRLAEVLQDSFRAVSEAISRLRQGDRDRGLRVSATAAFGHAILMPRLAEFWALHPRVPVSVEAENRAVDLRREGYDLGIRSGSGDWPGLEVELLANNRFQLAASPNLLAREPDITRLPWLLSSEFPDEYEWLRAAGYDPDRLNIINTPNGALAVTGAVHGYGLVFGTDAVLRSELDSGRLVNVEFPNLPNVSYYAVTLPGPRRPAVQAFIDWLRALVRKP